MSKMYQARRAMLLASAAVPLFMGAQPAFAQANTNGDTAAPAVTATDQVQTPDQQTQSADDNKPTDGEQAVVVTGYRKSLQSSTNAKRDSVGFTDSIFAEDMGKFPDTNIAESFNRIPGITISREVTGEGLRVSIRGLGTNFTRVTMNNAPIMVGSTGRTDDQGTNREVDLDIFPTELFTRLTVSKSPTAAMLEGGAAGVVDMRSARPFDNRGTHVVYSLQGTKNSNADRWGHRGSLLASHTMGDFGILAGVARVKSKINSTGFETIGWTNPNLTIPPANGATPAQILAAQCRGGASACNLTGGGNWTIPGTVPTNAGIPGVTAGTQINQDFLLAHNPGASLTQIDNGITPRLGRYMAEYGTKERSNAILAVEYKGEKLHAYIDSMYGKKQNVMTREAMTWVGRNGAVIPVNVTYDRTDCTAGCVVDTGTYYNAQWFLEFRPYREHLRYFGINPGVDYAFSDTLKLDLNANYTRSQFHRESPTVMPSTLINTGVTVDYDNTVGPIPSIQTNVDLNNPANFGWTGGRLNIQDERRRTYTKGVRGSAVWGDPHLNLHVGSAYDIVYRRIRGFDASQQWQNAVCGNNPSVFLPGPNGQPSCQGLNQPGAAPAGYPSYPAYGTGYTAGQAGPVTYAGSLIPSGAPLQGFLRPGPNGYITVDWDAFRKASNYDAFHDAAPETGGANTGASGGALREKTWGIFGEVNGDMDVGGNRLVYNAGMRWVKSNQSIGGRVSIPDPRNSTDPDGAGPLPTACPGGGANLRDGSCYPNIINFVYTEQSYTNWLPSASAAYHIGDHAVVRAALSKTMTRPNPANMLPGLNFSSPSADQGSVGNPALEPYLSKNIDLGFEYYTGSEGYFGLAAFRKSIQGFTENRNSPPLPFSTLAQYGVTYDTLSPTQRSAIDARGGPGAATVILTQQTNVPGKLNINGLEFTWVQPLDFLLGRFGLNGFGFNANLTIVDQSGSGSAAGLAVATGVPPRSRNITGYYENHGVSLRLSNTFSKGFQASGPGQNGISAAALFTDDYHQWDFAGSLELSKILGMRSLPDLTLDVQNITKEAQRSYFQFPNAAFTYYKPGRIVMAGIRGKF